ncbi:hypothetical protein DUNSADRAFT_10336 [Dunaliella salina]|uniref:Protein transport protein Sec61 subunit beta n=1 Tax=Dunaliella salina TaxID=3046 RepID=A0ABQ7H4W4_DUNSA|nr:hypothetical protein DUNSADRAFT_10336 [Dunaliella salina]|mmetsp:Transcript_16159/g.44149  ORF Transcript_16159/g.44149 Transcript_16159/m.44149 type:complete len:86 (+) Transcript_16159:127-384(+)|eukprot:KAF5841899.1 hypothetical protein DUNSADRAFT_10336 [Dunaliella salina]
MVTQSSGAIAARSGSGERGAPPSGTGLRSRAGRSGGARGSRSAMSYGQMDDSATGIMIQPVYVVAMSVLFIFFVAILHVIAKLRS